MFGGVGAFAVEVKTRIFCIGIWAFSFESGFQLQSFC
jgi:hypothetical protein